MIYTDEYLKKMNTDNKNNLKMNKFENWGEKIDETF